MQTAKAELVSRALGQPIGPWLRKRHDNGWSWRDLTGEVYAATGYQVNHESLRQWAQR
jgi:uncharacterized protein YfiM (DUF2279 family)